MAMAEDPDQGREQQIHDHAPRPAVQEQHIERRDRRHRRQEDREGRHGPGGPRQALRHEKDRARECNCGGQKEDHARHGHDGSCERVRRKEELRQEAGVRRDPQQDGADQQAQPELGTIAHRQPHGEHVEPDARQQPDESSEEHHFLQDTSQEGARSLEGHRQADRAAARYPEIDDLSCLGSLAQGERPTRALGHGMRDPLVDPGVGTVARGHECRDIAQRRVADREGPGLVRRQARGKANPYRGAIEPEHRCIFAARHEVQGLLGGQDIGEREGPARIAGHLDLSLQARRLLRELRHSECRGRCKQQRGEDQQERPCRPH